MSNIKTVQLQVRDARRKLVNVYNTNYSTVTKQRLFEDFKEAETIFLLLEQKLTLLLDSENEKSSQSSQGDVSNSSNAM